MNKVFNTAPCASARLQSGARRLLPMLLLLVPLAITACAKTHGEVVSPQIEPTRTDLTFQKDIRPILDQKCVACHACNDAPCQLNLSSAEGLERGATTIRVYEGTRKKDISPTRLGIDAMRTDQWREKGFFPVLPVVTGDPDNAAQASLLSAMLKLGKANSWKSGARLPEDFEICLDRENVCPTSEEFEDYADEHAQHGMPWGVSGLTSREYDTVQSWIAGGARLEPSEFKASEAELKSIEKWEQFLNRTGEKEALVSRYLFEHLFLAHLHFPKHGSRHFFELIRSFTPPGEQMVPVATVRPNGDAGSRIYYRFRLIDATIVAKTHITYDLSDKKLERFNKLFFAEPWEVDGLPAYDDSAAANPFKTFFAIPAKARYQFMLDDAEYFVRTFIRGPVCAGQTATNVIRDQFWVAFEDPAHDIYVNHLDYRAEATPLIGVPGQDSDLIDGGEEWDRYKEQRNRYIKLREAFLASRYPEGPAMADLWDGEGWNPDAVLTVFRHHDNASVRRGLHGEIPLTLWVMDYPLLERTYYQLVVNFNVFGSVSHQLQTRLYFDLIRNEGEFNFLRFLPRDARQPLRDRWYADSGKAKLFTTYAIPEDKVPTRIELAATDAEDAKRELAEKLLRWSGDIRNESLDWGRCKASSCLDQEKDATSRKIGAALFPLTQARARDMPAIRLLPEITYLRVKATPESEPRIYAFIHNRAHSNVAFLLGEEQRYIPEDDSLTILPGIVGTYPNFMFDVPEREIGPFAQAFAKVSEKKHFTALVERWGVRRTRSDFWDIFHDLTRYQENHDPLEAGIMDLNRYENL